MSSVSLAHRHFEIGWQIWPAIICKNMPSIIVEHGGKYVILGPECAQNFHSCLLVTEGDGRTCVGAQCVGQRCELTDGRCPKTRALINREPGARQREG